MDGGLIAVDRFAEGSRAYFLTHLHADHTRGLSPTWSRGPLFLSPTSALLLPSRIPGFDTSLLRPIPVGATIEVEVAGGIDGASDDASFLVTAIDAHHCAGAVMFLFRGEFGCVLYTGDFRWELNSKRSSAAKKSLIDALEGNKVDLLYLDNTYCNPSFSFPPREVASQQVVDIIRANAQDEFIIGIDSLGKEELLIDISKALGMKIWVWPERLETVDLLGHDDIFTTRTSLTRVRAVPRYSMTYETLLTLNFMHPTLAIMPTGLPWAMKGCDDPKRPIELVGQYFFSVPYSDHSCFIEIADFMKLVQPSKVIGIVSKSFCNVDPCHYFDKYSVARNIPCEPPKDHVDPNSRIAKPRCNLDARDIPYEPDPEDTKKEFSKLRCSCLRISKKRERSKSIAFKLQKARPSSKILQASRILFERRKQRGAKLSEAVDVYEFLNQGGEHKVQT